MVILKKKWQIKGNMDFKYLNLATPKDEYTILMANTLINTISDNKILSFINDQSGYNQVFIIEKNIFKIVFRCSNSLGMPFRCKSASAIYQKAMNLIFHDMLNHNIKVYINDIMIKLKLKSTCLNELHAIFECMRMHKLKINLLKYVFGL